MTTSLNVDLLFISRRYYTKKTLNKGKHTDKYNFNIYVTFSLRNSTTRISLTLNRLRLNTLISSRMKTKTERKRRTQEAFVQQDQCDQVYVWGRISSAIH